MAYKPPVKPIFGTSPAKPKKKKSVKVGPGKGVDPFSIGGTLLHRPLTPIGDLSTLTPPGRPASVKPHDLPVQRPAAPRVARAPRRKPVVKSTPAPRQAATPRTDTAAPPATAEKPVTVAKPPVPPAVRAKPAPKPKAAKPSPVRTQAAVPQQTVAQQVQSLVNSIVNPQLNVLNEQAKQQNAAIQQGAQELIRELNGLPPVNYQAAADQVAQLAALASAGLSNANPNQTDQTLLRAINAPAAQQEQVRNQLANTFGGGASVLFQNAGKIPAQGIIEQGLSGQTLDRGLPGVLALQSQQALRSALYNQASKRQDVLSQLPKLRMDIQNALADQQAKKQQLDIERQAFGLKAQGQAFDQAVTTAKLKNDSLRIATSKLNSDRNYQLGLDRLGVSQGNLRLRAAQLDAKVKQTAKNGGFTTSQKLQLKKRAGKVASDAFNGIPVKQDGEIVGYNHQTYQQAVKSMLTQGIPLTFAQAALNVYWKAGEDKPWEQSGEGRPVQSFQVRQALKKKRSGGRR